MNEGGLLGGQEKHGSSVRTSRLSLKAVTAFAAVAVAFSLTGAFAQNQKAGTAKADGAGNADSGKQLFASVGCASCHGTAAKGMSGMGPQIAPPPLAGPQFLDFVRHPTGAMKAYSQDEVSDAQLRDIYAYLQSLAGSASAAAPASDAPAGNAESGKRLYTADGCYECHGYVAQGGSGSGPKLAPHPILFSAFIAQLRHPREEMPPYTAKVISDSEVADIYAYLQTLPEAPKVENLPLLK